MKKTQVHDGRVVELADDEGDLHRVPHVRRVAKLRRVRRRRREGVLRDAAEAAAGDDVNGMKKRKRKGKEIWPRGFDEVEVELISLPLSLSLLFSPHPSAFQFGSTHQLFINPLNWLVSFAIFYTHTQQDLDFFSSTFFL